MTYASQRTLAIIELLSEHPRGLPLGTIASELSIPPSATHRLLSELQTAGYVRRPNESQEYAISLKLVSLALDYLSEIDLIEHAKPVVDRLARETGMLARLSIVDENRLIWVLKAQGGHSNIRYDPPMHHVVQLSAAAAGHAWLAHMTDEQALGIVLAQGLKTKGLGPEVPTTVEQVLKQVHTAREQGWAYVRNSYEKGIAALAVAIRNPKNGFVTGVLSIAGLLDQFEDDAVEEFVSVLQDAAVGLADARLDYAKYLVSPYSPRIYVEEEER